MSTEIINASNSISVNVHDGTGWGITWAALRALTNYTGSAPDTPYYQWNDTVFGAGDPRLWIKLTRAFEQFDLSAIPSGATVTGVTFESRAYFSNGSSESVVLAGNSYTGSSATAYASMFTGVGSQISDNEYAIDASVPAIESFTLNSTGIAFVQSCLASGWCWVTTLLKSDFLDSEPSVSGLGYRTRWYDSGYAKLTIDYTVEEEDDANLYHWNG